MMNSIDIRLLGIEPDDKRMAAASIQAFREIESMWQCGTINDLEFVRLGRSCGLDDGSFRVCRWRRSI